CGTPRRPDTLVYSQQRMRNVVIAPDLLLSSPFPTGGSHNFSHCQVGPTGPIRLLPLAPARSPSASTHTMPAVALTPPSAVFQVAPPAILPARRRRRARRGPRPSLWLATIGAS